jgi:GGDEF domain-containing protein
LLLPAHPAPAERAPLSPIFLKLLPGAVLLLAATVALNSAALRATVWSLVPAYPWTVLGGGILLGWRFDRSRLALTLVTLLLADQALHGWAPAGGAGEVGRAVFAGVALLLPLDLALLAWLPERGLLAVPGRLALGALAAQVGLIALLGQPLFLPLAGWLERPIVGARFGAMPEASLLLFLVAFGVLAARAVLHASALESGAVWTLVAAFLAVGVGGGGLDSSVYLGTGGLVLVVSLIETWHGMAYLDELTGLPARRALNEALGRLRGRYSVAMVDLDHFKRFNDTHGHDAGDQLLRMVGARLAAIGGGGHAFRYGGEEFAVLFPGKGVPEALDPLETLRRTIEATPFVLRAPDRPPARPERPPPPGGRRRISVTVSIGVAAADGDRSPDDVVRDADQALYRAKQAGRNRVST